MRKLIWFGVLSLGALSLSAQSSEAGLHHWKCGRCCNKYSTYICCTPYNAFSPVCFGSICCNGGCPLQMGCGGAPCVPPPMVPPMCSPFPGGYPCPDMGCPQPNCFSSGCFDTASLPPPGLMAPPGMVPGSGFQFNPGHPPTAPMPGAAPGNFTPPPPTPMGGAISYYGMPMVNPVQPVGYPGYPQYGYPQYNPAYNPYQMPAGYAPNPWYGYRPYGY